MAERGSYAHAEDALRHRSGVVIPVYFPPNAGETAEGVLRETVLSFLGQVGSPSHICLSVDGEQGGAKAAAEGLAREHGVRVVVSRRNRGKLHAVRLGMGSLLSGTSLELLFVADQDGDHFANESLNFVRSVEHIEASADTDRAMVLGRRISRHRPMGFLRGELEELADRVLLDALQYDAAVTGVPLRLEFANVLDEFPDFHSGYKLFTRTVAEAVFNAEPGLCGVSDDCFYRHACEAVMSVEALKAGGILGVVNRTTLDEQPMSAFGLLNRQQLVADKIIWPCRRLEVPVPFVDQWLRNHMPRLLLGSLAPEGAEELLAIREMVLRALSDTDPPPGVGLTRPRFV
jgi:hypothetical protein